jgi:hypothetical protein
VSAAEDIERQIAVAVVIAVEEPTFLMAVQRVVGRVEIEGDLLGRLGMRLQEQIDEQPLDRRPVVADLVIARGFRPAQFQPVQRRLAGHWRAVPAPRLKLTRQHRHHRVIPQLVVVVQVLVAERQAEHALADQRAHRMLDQHRRTRIAEAGREPIDQPDCSVRGAQQQRTGIRRDRPTIKRRDHAAPCDACKSKQIRATLCRHRGPPAKLVKSFSQNNFLRFSAPMHLPGVRDPG